MRRKAMSRAFRNREGLCHRAALQENATMRPVQAFAAAIIMTTSVGTIHAFSVFVAPLEDIAGERQGHRESGLQPGVGQPDPGRSDRPAPLAPGVSGLVATGSTVCWPRWAPRSPPLPSVTALYLGYGLLFGFANGTGYGFALVIASNALPERRGVAMGVVTAMYAVGASAATWLFRYSNTATRVTPRRCW